MMSVFCIFFLELAAFRWGTAKLAKAGITYDTHGHGAGGSGRHGAHGPEMMESKDEENSSVGDGASPPEHHHNHLADSPLAQIVGVAILEFGVIFHSALIGLTLAVTTEFKTLFIVIVFHQSFEGLGLGTRLAFLELPASYNWVPFAGAVLYSFTTPIGIAAGLGVRSTYNPEGTTAAIVSGVLDAISAGILLYTGLIELLAHEFLFNPKMHTASNAKVAYACICMCLGAGLMSLLGRWA
jgi:zinc transporter 1/2/3